MSLSGRRATSERRWCTLYSASQRLKFIPVCLLRVVDSCVRLVPTRRERVTRSRLGFKKGFCSFITDRIRWYRRLSAFVVTSVFASEWSGNFICGREISGSGSCISNQAAWWLINKSNNWRRRRRWFLHQRYPPVRIAMSKIMTPVRIYWMSRACSASTFWLFKRVDNSSFCRLSLIIFLRMFICSWA